MNETLEVKRSPIHGKGVFAKRRIPANTLMGVFEGEPTTRNGRYVLWVEYDDGEMVGIKGCNELRYLNHSRSANAYLCGEELFSLHDIQPGTEITCDYGEDWADIDGGAALATPDQSGTHAPVAAQDALVDTRAITTNPKITLEST
jgi:SET domain-containing protein